MCSVDARHNFHPIILNQVSEPNAGANNVAIFFYFCQIETVVMAIVSYFANELELKQMIPFKKKKESNHLFRSFVASAFNATLSQTKFFALD